jgi:hypothetical protein
MAVVTQIQVRRGTAASWVSANPTLAAGEWGMETDTKLYKIGDGSTTWNNLIYANNLTVVGTRTFTTNAYTLVASDAADTLLVTNAASAGTLYIPTNASVPFPIGTQINLIQSGSGQITITATTPATTTINSTGATSTSPKLRVQNSSATLLKTATDTWYVVGDIS